MSGYITINTDEQRGTAWETGNKRQQKIYNDTNPESWNERLALQQAYDGTSGSKGWAIKDNGIYTYTAPRSLAIAVNYGLVDASKDFGPYHGASYLWLGGKEKECFTIMNVKAGTTITMGVESHKVSDARGVQLIVK